MSRFYTKDVEDLNVKFDHCLIKSDPEKLDPIKKNPEYFAESFLVKQDTIFVGQSKAYENLLKDKEDGKDVEIPQFYMLFEKSPALMKGKAEIGAQFPIDINGKNRAVTKPDLGAYQSSN